MKLYPLTPSDRTDPAFLYIAETLAKAISKLTDKRHAAKSVRALENGLFEVRINETTLATFDFSADTSDTVRKELAGKHNGRTIRKINNALVVFVGFELKRQAVTARK